MSATLTPPRQHHPEFESPAEDLQRDGRHDEQSDIQALRDAFSPQQLRWNNLDWDVVIWMVVMHAGCLAAPFFFSWSALGVTVLLHWLTASIGICLGYHRYLAHQSFRLTKPAEFFTLACGAISGEGTPLRWSAVHRMHHNLSDQPGDPHSPFDGRWWSHLLWFCIKVPRPKQEILFRRYIPQLCEQPMLRFFERTAPWWIVLIGVSLLGLGWSLGGVTGAASMFLWAMCVRMVLAYHSTWLVNSATHLWGYRNYETRDQSRNLWWVALFAYGEGWHNNHHAHPSIAPAGHRWWEIDMTWWTIKLWRMLGLAYDVKDEIPPTATTTSV